MNAKDLKQQLDLEVESIGINHLTEVGNMAVSMGLIAGHGFRGGKYEILRKGEVILLPVEAATDYLEQLIKTVIEP
ncbi:hypothetical protein [Pseudanabaena sp. ABRG5-3]|uniref:hypothetical protein n=1 Tax=Pseudanabaena sp. ABRG5-3 TaxID=685565 RepID=UPI000DC6E360|nr:hypothetical protein [Pseudanabaena sp. ABRG5-3]BBC27043.1 hypothetical protein ABRG53_d078 [Pseudanabaena sp. ABRG5-3]